MVNTTTTKRDLWRPGAIDFSIVRGLSDVAARWAPLPLRIVLGIVFVIAGAPKLNAGGHTQFAGMLQNLGLPAPDFFAYLVGCVELFGGVALLAGALVGLTAIILIIEMACAAWLVHLPQGFATMHIVGMGPNGPIFGMPGYQHNVELIAALAALFLMGAGKLSVDELWERRHYVRSAV